RGIRKDKIEVITNGSNMELFYPREADLDLLGSLGLNDKFVVGYIGTHGMAHGLDFIVKSIRKVSDPSIHFLFIGDGATKQGIVKLAKELNLINITFLDPIDKEQVPKYLSIVDVSLAPLIKSDTFKTVIPSKIFESSAMQKPTLLGVEGQAQEILEKYGAGVCFEPENEKDFLEKLNVLKEVSVYEKCQAGCEVLAKEYDRKVLANKMLNVIKTVEGGSR
ncbi:glycosyltransferase family 4 protein, partial [uncultured Sulfurimonas sp.]|uniref:glycosyltransferase family 4 protein n=1 Tax=uncultured Sulfurimonas sp. TaxID=291845 RepID=UPI0032B128EA